MSKPPFPKAFEIAALAGLLALALSGSACTRSEARRPAADPEVVMKAVRDYGRGHQALLTPGSTEKPDQPDAAYSAHIRNVLVQEDFAQLEKIAQQNRTEKGRLLGGVWKIYAFYDGTGRLSGDLNSKQSDFQLQTATLNKWISAYPNSTAARLSLAQLYLDEGWNARGSGLANTVSRSQWDVMEEKTSQAKAILLEIAPFKDKDPMWYQAMMQVAQSEGWEKAQFRELFDQAVAFEPGFYHYYRLYANILLPQWYGEPGELEAFAAEIAKRVPEPDGSILYFQILSALDCYCKASIEALQTVDYPRIRQGYLNNSRLYGVTNLTANRFAFVASVLKDKSSAHDAFASVENMDGDTWQNPAVFEQFRTWANTP